MCVSCELVSGNPICSKLYLNFDGIKEEWKNNNSNHYWCPHTMCKVFAFKSIIKWWNILDFPDFVSLLFSFWFSVMSCHVMLCLCCVARISLSKPFSHFISNWWTDTNLFHCAQPDANAILMIGNRILIENSDAFAYKLGCAFRIYAQTNTSEWQNIRWLSHFADEKKLQQTLLTYSLAYICTVLNCKRTSEALRLHFMK